MRQPNRSRALLVESIPVSLGVEVARLSLSVSELLELQPGTVIEIPLKRKGTVTLMLGDTPVAEAAIRSEGGELFLEIVEVFTLEETSEAESR